MSNIEILKKFIIYILVGISICLVGASGVFADTTIDSNSFFSVTGRRWSISSTDYQESAPVISNNWVKHYFNVPSGIYTPPNNFDYITLSYFQHNGNYNPCNNNDYRVSYSLKFTNTSFVNYVRLITFADSNCSYVADSSNGLISVNCPVNYDSSAGGLWLSVWYNEISGNSASDLYLSRYISLSCDLDTSAITDNATENTQNIINNNNQNTQDIINNNNSNTDKIIDSNKVCDIISDADTISYGYLGSNGSIQSSGSYRYTDYIELTNSSTLKPISVFSSTASLCFYNKNKTLISCILNRDMSLNNNLTIPSKAKYFRASLYNDSPNFELCSNGSDETNKTSKGIFSKLKELFNFFNNNDNADVSGLNNMAGWLPPGPLDSIINLPLSFFNALTNTLTGTCVAVTLTLPFVNQTLTLPCFDSFMSTYLTGFSTLWNFIGITLSVFILYRYLLSLYKWVDDTLTLRENNLPGYYDDSWGGGA